MLQNSHPLKAAGQQRRKRYLPVNPLSAWANLQTRWGAKRSPASSCRRALLLSHGTALFSPRKGCKLPGEPVSALGASPLQGLRHQLCRDTCLSAGHRPAPEQEAGYVTRGWEVAWLLEQRALRTVDEVILTHLNGYSRRKQPEGHFNTVILTFADHCPLDLSVP